MFKGLQIDQIDYDWQHYPILHFDFARIESRNCTAFENALKRKLQSMGLSAGIPIETPTVQEGLESLVIRVYQRKIPWSF